MAPKIDCLKFEKEVHMADTIIVATFDNTNAAYDAASALKKLKDQKIVDFKPKAGVMVKKDELGNLSLLGKQGALSMGNGGRHHCWRTDWTARRGPRGCTRSSLGCN